MVLPGAAAGRVFGTAARPEAEGQSESFPARRLQSRWGGSAVGRNGWVQEG